MAINSLNFVSIGMYLTLAKVKTKKKHAFHASKKFVAANLEIVLLAPLYDKINMISIRLIVYSHHYQHHHEIPSLLPKTNLVYNFIGTMLEMTWFIPNA